MRHDPHPEVNPTGSTLPPLLCSHTCIAPSGERLTCTQSARLRDRLRYLQASPLLLFGTVTGGRYALASRRKACHTPSSLRKLVAVSLWQARRRLQIPSVAAPTAATRHGHGLTLAARACARHSGSGTGLPHGVERRYHPAHVWQALRPVPVACAWWQPPASGPLRSPPLVCRCGICVGQRTGRRVAGSLRAGCARRRISYPQCGSRRRFASSACHRTTAATHHFLWQPNAGDQARRLGPSPGPSPPAVQSAE